MESKSRDGCRVLLIGAPAFPEEVLTWCNFVACTPEEIAQAHEDWQSHQRFGEVKAYLGRRLDAPPLKAVRIAKSSKLIKFQDSVQIHPGTLR